MGTFIVKIAYSLLFTRTVSGQHMEYSFSWSESLKLTLTEFLFGKALGSDIGGPDAGNRSGVPGKPGPSLPVEASTPVEQVLKLSSVDVALSFCPSPSAAPRNSIGSKVLEQLVVCGVDELLTDDWS